MMTLTGQIRGAYDPDRSQVEERSPQNALLLGKQSSASDCHVLPLLPLLPGLAVNTVLYAVILWLGLAFPFIVRRHRRKRRNLCPCCAYPIGQSATCSECGQALTGLRRDAPPRAARATSFKSSNSKPDTFPTSRHWNRLNDAVSTR